MHAHAVEGFERARSPAAPLGIASWCVRRRLGWLVLVGWLVGWLWLVGVRPSERGDIGWRQRREAACWRQKGALLIAANLLVLTGKGTG